MNTLRVAAFVIVFGRCYAPFSWTETVLVPTPTRNSISTRASITEITRDIIGVPIIIIFRNMKINGNGDGTVYAQL